MSNPLLLTDTYKPSHWPLYRQDATNLFQYVESRGCAKGFNFTDTMFFGLQYILARHFSEPITHAHVDEAKAVFAQHLGRADVFNEAGFRYIVDQHGGRLPLRIRAVKEGTIVPLLNCLVTVEVTDPKVFWLGSYFEAVLLRAWYPITAATWGAEAFRTLWRALAATTDLTDDEKLAAIVFMLHDFGDRGVSCDEQAGLGGCAHLSLFKGTDTLPALDIARRYYGCEMAGFSVPATEHSVMTHEGPEGECAVTGRVLDAYLKPGAIVSIVGDSYDIYNFTSNLIGGVYRDRILTSGGKVVVRPDSGHPPTIVVDILELLWERFGGTTNAKGFRVLAPCVGVLQGDGIDLAMIEEILTAMAQAGFAASNVVFGSGGARLMAYNRDTLKFAMKASHLTYEGGERDVFKDPVTDHGKVSKKGRLDLVLTERGYETVRVESGEIPENSQLQLVYENGVCLNQDSLDAIRERAYAQLIGELKAEEAAQRAAA